MYILDVPFKSDSVFLTWANSSSCVCLQKKMNDLQIFK